MNLSAYIRNDIASIPVGPGDLKAVHRAGSRRRGRRRLMAAAATVTLVGVAATGWALNERSYQPVVALDAVDTAAVAVPGTNGSMLSIPTENRNGPVVVSGRTLNSGTETTSGYRGEVVLIRYWAEWCRPCAADALTEIADAPDADFTILGAVIEGDSEIQGATDFARENEFAFESIVDAPETPFEQFGSSGRIKAAPATIALDPMGRVAGLKYGQFASLDEVQKFADLAR